MNFSIRFKGKAMPTVSVIITTYNRAEYVTKAIESVIGQTYQNWELVIVNDGSSDQTEEVVRQYVTTDGKVRYVKQANQGLSGARNKGISETRGKYITFLDDDDWWFPGKLKTQVAFMEEHLEIGLSYTQLRIIREISEKIDDSTVIPIMMATTLEEMLDDCFIPASTVMIRRECFNVIEWFKIDAVPQEDLEIWLRFVQRWKISAIRIPLTVMKKSERAQLSRDSVRSFKKEIEIIDALKLTPEYQYCKGLKIKSRIR